MRGLWYPARGARVLTSIGQKIRTYHNRTPWLYCLCPGSNVLKFPGFWLEAEISTVVTSQQYPSPVFFCVFLQAFCSPADGTKLLVHNHNIVALLFTYRNRFDVQHTQCSLCTQSIPQGAQKSIVDLDLHSEILGGEDEFLYSK